MTALPARPDRRAGFFVGWVGLLLTMVVAFAISVTMKSRAETETVIRRSAADKAWIVFTEDPVVLRKMNRLYGPGRPKSSVGMEWEIPLAGVGLRKPRVLTEEQRETASARLKVALRKNGSETPQR